jgi:hypothetical protein
MLDSPLQHLARRIAQTRSIDRAAKGLLARELKSLRSRLYPSLGQEVIDRVDAATLLMHYLAISEDSPTEALQLVARMTAALDDRFFAPAVPSPLDVAPAAAASPLDGLSATSRLGEIMVKTGIITEEQLNEALNIQRTWRLPLGTCVEKLGHATGAQVARALELQKKLRASAAPALPSEPQANHRPVGLNLDVRNSGPSLGELLLQRNMLAPPQLERAKTLQRAAGVTLEEALVQLQILTRDQVRAAVQIVERMKRS